MIKAAYHFPRGFKWGTSTSAYQVEGGNTTSNWHAWERSDQIEGRQMNDLACDWWSGRWREDFDRAADAGQNAHRLSIEWSRLQPAPDRWNDDALDNYRHMCRGLTERGLTPLVTLHHFTEPLWFSELGGWQAEDSPDRFTEYVRRVVEALKEYVDWWVTINEPNYYALQAYLFGIYPPGEKNLRAYYQALSNLIKAHASAYHVIHEMHPPSQVGTVHHYRGLQPGKPWSPLDRWAVNSTTKNFNYAVPQALSTGTLRLTGSISRIQGAKNTQDFFGLSYSTLDTLSFALKNPSDLFITKAEFDSGADIDITPTAKTLYEAIRWSKSFGLPIIIASNGIADGDDTRRPRYLAEHIHQLWRAANFNWKVQGYFHKTLVDSFEWEHGWDQPFGLWELNPKTQERISRPSADFYAAICRENGISADMVTEYAPEAFHNVFPTSA